jgi:hypothetical protein
MSFMRSKAEAGGVHAAGDGPPGASSWTVVLDIRSDEGAGALGPHAEEASTMIANTLHENLPDCKY